MIPPLYVRKKLPERHPFVIRRQLPVKQQFELRPEPFEGKIDEQGILPNPAAKGQYPATLPPRLPADYFDQRRMEISGCLFRRCTALYLPHNLPD